MVQLYNPREMRAEEIEATFVGRQHLLDRLIGAVREQTARDSLQHCLVLGPRGIGKTTLLLMLAKRVKADPVLSQHWLPVPYREEEFYVHTLRDLIALALEHLDAEEGLSEAGIILAEAEAEADDEKSLAIAVGGLRKISESCGKRFLLLIDNFEQVFPTTGGNATDQHALRKMLSTEHFLMIVGTSTLLLEEIFSYDEAFFNFFSPVYVDDLSEEEIQELFTARARLDDNQEFLRNYEQNAEKVRAITFLTGGNPRLILMLYKILSENQLLPVVEALRETIDKLTPLLKDILESLPRQQSKILDALMRLDGMASPSVIAQRVRLPLNVVTVQLGRLKERRWVEVEGGGKGRPAMYRVRDRMFRTWYQMRYLRPARRRVEMFVEFLRAWFSVEDRRVRLGDLQKKFGQFQAAGLALQAREAAMAMEYYAASFEDSPERARKLEDVADAYLKTGEMREVALTLADIGVQEVRSQVRYEMAGYTRLGYRLVQKGEISQALQAFAEVLKKEGENAEVRIGMGRCWGLSGEHERAAREFSAILEIPEAAPEQVAMALLYRGFTKRQLGDTEGEISDYTAVLSVEGAPVEQVAKALVNRGVAKGELGDTAGEISDYTAVLSVEGAPVEQVAKALLYRGASYEGLNQIEAAIADYKRGAEIRATAELVHEGSSSLILLFCKNDRVEEAGQWIARLAELEPEETKVEQRLEARIEIISSVARECSVEMAIVLLDAVLKTAPPDLEGRLRFLKPALELARTGDETILAKFPQEEQEIARRIAAQIKKERKD